MVVLTSGYGVQTKLFIPRIKALGYEPAIIAFYGLKGGVLNLGGVPVYPCGWDDYGNDIMSAHTLAYGANVLMSLMDIWVLNPAAIAPQIKYIPWFPVDMDPIPPRVLSVASTAHDRISFSHYGVKAVEDAGFNCHYVPHGVETSVYKPLDKAAAKKQVGMSPDGFTVGMVAMNKGFPSRKCFVQQIEAFALLHKKHPDTQMILHTWLSEHGEAGGINLVKVFEYFGLRLGTDVKVADPYGVQFGVPEDQMAVIYNSMDLLTSVSMGEGFGIPILEAQACGVPVVVGDWTSMPELCFAGWKVSKKEAVKEWTPLDSFQYSPQPEAIYERYEQAYLMRNSIEYSKRARDGAEKFDADRITEKYWKPVLAEIEAGLK